MPEWFGPGLSCPNNKPTVKDHGLTGFELKGWVLRFSETEAEEKLKVLPYLVSPEKEMRLELNVPPERKRVVMKGSPIWYEMNREGTMSKLKFGVLFTDMSREVRNTWVRYMERRNCLSYLGGKD